VVNKNTHTISIENSAEIDHLGELELNGKILFK